MDKKLILNKLKEHKKFSTNAEFARYIGITPQNLRNWYERDTYDINKLCIVFPEVSAEWLMTGEGTMLKVDATADNFEHTVAEPKFSYGIHGDNNQNNMNGTDNSVVNALIEQLKEKDQQIDRLLKIIEKMQ